MTPRETEDTIGQTPGPTTPAQKREKARFGRGFLMIFAGFAVIVFLIYIAIVMYGIFTAASG